MCDQPYWCHHLFRMKEGYWSLDHQVMDVWYRFTQVFLNMCHKTLVVSAVHCYATVWLLPRNFISLSSVTKSIVTKQLKLESHGFHCKVSPGILASHAKF